MTFDLVVFDVTSFGHAFEVRGPRFTTLAPALRDGKDLVRTAEKEGKKYRVALHVKDGDGKSVQVRTFDPVTMDWRHPLPVGNRRIEEATVD